MIDHYAKNMTSLTFITQHLEAPLEGPPCYLQSLIIKALATTSCTSISCDGRKAVIAALKGELLSIISEHLRSFYYINNAGSSMSHGHVSGKTQMAIHKKNTVFGCTCS